MGSCDLERASSSGSDAENCIDMYRSSLGELCTASPEQKPGSLETYKYGSSCSTSQSCASSTPPCMETRHCELGAQDRSELHPSSQRIISAAKPKGPRPGTRGHPWISPSPGRARSSHFPLNHPYSKRLDSRAWQSMSEQRDGLQPGPSTERVNQALWSEWGSGQTSGWNFVKSHCSPSTDGQLEMPVGSGLNDASHQIIGDLSRGGQEKIGRSSDISINHSDRELTGFEKAMISLENGRDFDVIPKYLSCIPGSSNARRKSDEGIVCAEQHEGLSRNDGHLHLNRKASLPWEASSEKNPVADQDAVNLEGRSTGGSFSRRTETSRRQEKLRKDDGGALVRPGATGESGQPTGPVFHPLPSLFSYPPQSLQPWLPTAGVKKDMPTVSLLNSCCLESRMVNDYMDSYQEMSLMLALPGMPISKAPKLTLEEAGNILRVVNEPLAVLKSGRLTKSASPNPNTLKPTDDIGVLALWLSPTSELKVIWHSLKHPAPKGQHPVDWKTEEESELFPFADGSPFEEVFCFMEASEELACISQNCGSESGTVGVRLDALEQHTIIETLRTLGAVLDDIQQDASFAVQDPSGRSFRLTRQSGHGRQRKELAEKLDAEKVKKGGRVSRETAKLQTLLRACQPEADKEESLFFWIAEPSVSKGKKILEEMQTQIAATPTLASKSGVPARKLQEVYECFAEATRIANAAKAAGDQSFATAHTFSSWFVFGPGLAAPSHLFAMGSSTTLFEQMAQASSTRSRSTSRSSLSSRSPRSSSPSSSDCQSNVQNLMTVSDSCVLSATANFLVSDKRWNINHLSTVTVTVAMGVRSTGDIVDKAKCEEVARECAHQMAKSRAECGAQAEAERLGRRRLEELTAEKIAKIPNQQARGSISTLSTCEAQTRPSFQENRTASLASSRIPLSDQEVLPFASCSTAGADEEPNHWQRNSGHLQSSPGFIPENMYIPSEDSTSHSNRDALNRLADQEPPLGLGFGSGPFAMRNGQRAHYGGARPPGYMYGHWHQSRSTGVDLYAQTGAWRPHGIKSQMPCPPVPTPWSQPLKHLALQGRIGVPPVRMHGMGTSQYPRHLPPMLPYLTLVNQGMIQEVKPVNFIGSSAQAHSTKPPVTGMQPSNPKNTHQTSLSDIWKRLGGDQLAFLDKLREKNMDIMCLESVDEFRRKSMGDIQKRKLLDTSRRSADSCRQLSFKARLHWKDDSEIRKKEGTSQ